MSLAALIVTGCAERAPPVTAEFVATLRQREPAADQAELASGRARYVQRCAGCHALPATTSVAPADWPREMAKMGAKARMPAAEQREALHYVLATWVVHDCAVAGSAAGG